MIKWIKSRKDMKTGSLTLLSEMALAKEIFDYWDDKGQGKLTIAQVTE